MIIVTGGAGFIGSNLVKGLNDIGREDIIIVDNLGKSEKHLNLNRLKYIDFIDKRDFPEILHELEDIEVIFHQGACSDTMESDGHYMMENNYEYSKFLLQYCAEHNVRLIYASSASVYGNGDDGFVEEPKCEYPLNVYAFSKFSFDNYVRKFMNNVSSQVVGLRYFNVYGPQENHKGRMASVAFHLFNQYAEDKQVKLFEGSQEFQRDFIYVKDVVDVNLFFFANPDKSGIFNCGTGKAESFIEIGKAFKAKYDDAVISEIPFPDSLKGKYQKYTCAELTNLRKIGYDKEFTSLAQGVSQYLDILQKSGGYIK